MRISTISPLFTAIFFISCNIDITNKTPKVVEYEELDFKNGKGYYEEHLYTGIVVARHANGDRKFESDFVKGLDNGQFKEWDEDGNLIEKSNSKAGKLHGKYIRYYPSGQKYFETTYNEGVPEGKALEWHENGELKIKYYFKEGVENGLYTLWNDQGVKILEGQMKDDKRHGEWYEYNEHRNQAFINLYDNGEIVKSEPQLN